MLEDRLKVLIKAKDYTLTALASESGIAVSRLSQYLAKKSDLRGSSLTKVLRCLDIDVEALISQKVSIELGLKEDSKNWTEDVGFLLKNLNKIERRTIVESLISKGKKSKDPHVQSTIERLNENRSDWLNVKPV